MAESDDTRLQRLDQKVVQLLPQLSRASGVKLIKSGKVSINGKPGLKPSYYLREADEVFIDYNTDSASITPDIDIPIIYEDDDCVVINKPAGLLSHSKGAFNPEATVATWLRPRLRDMAGDRAGIVHRLDRATSGVMICAKTPEALSWLQKQFSQRKVQKTYFAVVTGHMPHEHAMIDMPIERNPKRPQTFRVGRNGKHARTEYWIRAQNDRNSLLELRPQTGRTHQLRVHLNHLDHPIVGDVLYGGAPADRLYLHAANLELTLPNRVRQTFTAQTPASFGDMVS